MSYRFWVNLIADGIHLLVDHQFGLSLARRAFIVSLLNLLEKYAVDDAPVDDCLTKISWRR